MAEPTVQVPVSLIEELDRFFEVAQVTGRLPDNVRALLTRPTPTATADESCREEGCQYRHWRSGDLGTTHKRGSGCPAPTAPPSIADMVPGTRCREEVSGTVPSWAGEDQISPCLCVLDAGHDGRHKCDHQVDPSTIRDATPPAVTP